MLRSKLYHVGAVCMKNHMHTFCGVNPAGKALASVERLDSAGNWQARTDLPTPRFSASVAQLGEYIFVIGGYNGKFLTSNDRYDPVLNHWRSRLAPLTPGRRWQGLATTSTYMSLAGTTASWEHE